jgi:hypothetical protein
MIQSKHNHKDNHKFGLISGVEGYKNYKKRFPNTELSRKEYAEILETFFSEAKDYILNGREFKIPHRLGSLRIIKVKGDLKKLKVDWKSTKQLWEKDEECKEKKQLVYHLNEHTNGDYYRLYFKKGKVKNISAVSFTPTRGLSRELASKIKNERKDYLHRK